MRGLLSSPGVVLLSAASFVLAFAAFLTGQSAITVSAICLLLHLASSNMVTFVLILYFIMTLLCGLLSNWVGWLSSSVPIIFFIALVLSYFYGIIREMKYRISQLDIFLILYVSLFFIAGYVYGPQSPYSTYKLQRVLWYLVYFYLAFLTLLFARNVDYFKFGTTSITASLFLFAFIAEMVPATRPSNIFAAGCFREATFALHEVEAVSSARNAMAWLTTLGIGSLLSLYVSRDSCPRYCKYVGIVYIGIGLLFILWFGSRTYSIVASAQLGLATYSLLRTRVRFAAVYGILTILALTLGIGASLESNNPLLGMELESRSYVWSQGLEKINEAPFFGHGLGGFVPEGGDIRVRNYPHNIIFELTSEFGVLGVFVMIVIFSLVYYKHWWSPAFGWYLPAVQIKFILICMVFLIQSMTIYDLTKNISVIAILIVLSQHRKIRHPPQSAGIFYKSL